MPFKKLLKSFVQDLENYTQPLQQQYGQQYGQQFGQQYGQQYGGFSGLGALAQQPLIPQQTTPCPRQAPEAGYQDWIGLNDPRFQDFHVCPTCYNGSLRPTPYANQFVSKAVPPHVAVRCDMSRYWVKAAGMVLLTMNQTRQYDITLLPRVASIRVQDGDCPNAQMEGDNAARPVVQRAWYNVRDPYTGAMPMQAWTICTSCLANLQTMCPSIGNSFAPVAPGPVQGSCAFVPSERFDHAYTAQQLQHVATCQVMSVMSGRPDMSYLINWVRENPFPAPGAPGSGMQGGIVGPRQPDGLCPRNFRSSTLRCHTMREVFDFTVCEQCYADIVKPDADRGIQLARLFDSTPSAMSAGFTCQLYSDRMRRVWSEAAASGNIDFLRQKVNERRIKERELETKTLQLQQQAQHLRQQADLQQHQAANAFRVEANRANNNIMLAGVGVEHRIDAFTVEVPDTSANFNPMLRMNNQASMMKVQAAQLEDQIKFGEDEWRRYWE